MSGSDRASEDAVLYEATASGVAILTFNRPERLNAWGPDIAAGFYAAIDRAEQDPAAMSGPQALRRSGRLKVRIATPLAVAS